jgi:hypothetical protein
LAGQPGRAGDDPLDIVKQFGVRFIQAGPDFVEESHGFGGWWRSG